MLSRKKMPRDYFNRTVVIPIERARRPFTASRSISFGFSDRRKERQTSYSLRLKIEKLMVQVKTST